MPARKKIKVVHRKLGREQAIGQATSKAFTPRDGLIEIEERLSNKKAFETLIHETLHHALPTTHEDEILRIEKEIAPVIWNELKKNPERYK